MKNIKTETTQGYIVISVIVFASVFAMLLAGLTGFVFVQNSAQVSKENRERAIQIAEAGLDYYKWFLAHNPDDLTNGTGQPGPYQISYNDPEGGAIGVFELDISSSDNQCGETQAVEIFSTGWTNERPELKREVFGKYARPSVAEFAFVINGNVWAGADRNIRGPYHSNGGIRMDGTNQSSVTSAVSTWLCTSSFGCNPSYTAPGVWGAGSGSALWKYPEPQIDFVGITVDLVNMKTSAQSEGVYLAPSGAQGYHMILRSDDTFDLYRVDSTNYAWSIHVDDIGGGWKRDYHTITNETFLQNYILPSSCNLVFVEDKLWIEGTVNRKVTVASADITQPNVDTDVIIQGDITYNTAASSGLTVVAENSVLIPLVINDNLSLNGIFIAQNGYYGRNLYPCWYAPYDKRNSLTMNGTVVSSDRVGTKWGYSTGGCWGEWSGFNTRDNFYDRNLTTAPPPLTPNVSDDYEFVEWREVE